MAPLGGRNKEKHFLACSKGAFLMRNPAKSFFVLYESMQHNASSHEFEHFLGKKAFQANEHLLRAFFLAILCLRVLAMSVERQLKSPYGAF